MAAFLCATGPAVAFQDSQPQRRPGSDPQLQSEGVESALDAMRKRDNAPTAPVAPTPARARPAPPSAGQAKAPVASGAAAGATRSWREGTFIASRGGTLVRATGGDWIFVPRPTTDGAIDPPLILLPSRNLEQLEALLDPAVVHPPVLISGEVFSYRARDYLLVGEASRPATAEPGPAEAQPAPPSDPEAPVRAEDLIRELETRAVRPRALPRGTPAPAGLAAGSPSATGGSLLTARRGRLVRLPDGDLAFTPDNDAASPDGPMRLIPCRTLAKMEALSLWRQDGVPLEVSGRVLAYRGTTYLLPTMCVSRPRSDVEPLQ